MVDTVLAAGAVTDADKHLNKVNEYGRNDHLGGQTLNLEFVSANPTGPIHIGGTRWAAVGDAMARVLEANGAKVVREYYFNDHGEQINRFAKSLVAAWAEANNLGEAGYQTETPCDGYKGAYINEIAARVQAEAESDGVDLTALAHQDQGLNDDGEPLGEADTEVREEFRKRAVPMMFDEIQKSMKDFRVNFDVWFHENSLYADGKVDAAVLDVLNDLKDVTPAATNARISATHSPENGAEKTEKSERELHYDVKYPYDLSHEEVSDTDKALAAAMEAIADGPSIAVLKIILANQDVLELVGAHSHIGSNIHDAEAFIHAAKRMMLLRKTLWATDAYILPEIDLGGGYSVAYTDGEDSMDIDVELTRLADAVNSTNRALGMPAPAISFEPGRYIVAPAGVTLYRVGTIKHVHLSDAKDSAGNPIAERVYVSVDGGMSDNIRPALYGADYTARLANRTGSAETMLARVCGMHCESGDIVVHEVQLPADLKRGDILAVPVTGAYGRTMASNYNQALIPAVVAVSESGAHVMLRRQTVDDLLNLDVSE